jgi:hypothetical protein
MECCSHTICCGGVRRLIRLVCGSVVWVVRNVVRLGVFLVSKKWVCVECVFNGQKPGSLPNLLYVALTRPKVHHTNFLLMTSAKILPVANVPSPITILECLMLILNRFIINNLIYCYKIIELYLTNI